MTLPRAAVGGAAAAAVLGALVLAGVISGRGTPAPPPATAEPAGPVDVAAPVDADGPVEAIGGISALRAEAFSTGDRDLLVGADASGSPALAADLAVLDRLAEQDAVLRGLALTVEQVTLVQQEDAAARVRATTVTSAHSVVRVSDGALLDDVPASGPRTVELDLRRVDDTWLVAAVLAPRE